MENKRVFVFKNGNAVDRYTVIDLSTGEKEDADEFILLNVKNSKHPDRDINGVMGYLLDNTNTYLIEQLTHTKGWDCVAYTSKGIQTAFTEFGHGLNQSAMGCGMVWFRGEVVVNNRTHYRHLDRTYLGAFYEPHKPERPTARPLVERRAEEDLEDIEPWEDPDDDI